MRHPLPLDVLAVASSGDFARAGYLLDSVCAQQVLEPLHLVLASSRLDGQRALAHIDDAGTEKVRDLDDLASFLSRSVHLEQHEIALD